ncbi:serine hydrolase domain-containing protein [Amycolatopsis sp. NPDC004079]|uniref:serine hydrolase domain-containing protein n=1 Tax=Amycolatopsis sp. NPDC004079 TaxID=3154549 RepID=UPI00339EF648
MTHEALRRHVKSGFVPGAVALIAHGDDVQVTALGSLDAEGTAPMARDSIFRLASITKPITAAAVLLLIEDGRFDLDTPIAEWLPELADPMVVRTPRSPVDDVVPAEKPITVRDLLTFRAGYGFPSDFSLPQVQELFTVQTDGREVRLRPGPDEWLARLARIPLLHQPGEAWLYDTCADLQGILIARASGQSLPDFLAERVFEPLGMADTAFEVPAAKRHRFASYYREGENGLELADRPDGQWREVPPFPAGSGGLAGTADDWHRFARMLLSDGDGLLSKESVRQMTTNHLTAEQIAANPVFLEGQGWGFGGAVDVEPAQPWQVAGRYGWVGGTGTSAYLTPSRSSVAILLTQRAVDGPGGIPHMLDFWREAAAPQ